MRVLKLQTHPSAAHRRPKRKDKDKQTHWTRKSALSLSDACIVSEAELFLTEHGEDEVLGRVDLERALVVILALLVLAELGDQPVELLYPGSGPEVQLGGLRDVFGAARCGGRAVASWTSPAGERRRRHVREETVNRSRGAQALYWSWRRDDAQLRTDTDLFIYFLLDTS